MAFSINSTRSKIGENNFENRSYEPLFLKNVLFFSGNFYRYFIGHIFDLGRFLAGQFDIGWRADHFTSRAQIRRRIFDQIQHFWQEQRLQGDKEDWPTFEA